MCGDLILGEYLFAFNFMKLKIVARTNISYIYCCIIPALLVKCYLLLWTCDIFTHFLNIFAASCMTLFPLFFYDDTSRNWEVDHFSFQVNGNRAIPGMKCYHLIWYPELTLMNLYINLAVTLVSPFNIDYMSK